jgi:hypothetical protein
VSPSSCTDLFLQLPLGAFEVLDEQVFAGKLLVIGKVVDALPIMQVQLVQLVVDPAAYTVVLWDSMCTGKIPSNAEDTVV